jgi:hypothetical protein
MVGPAARCPHLAALLVSAVAPMIPSGSIRAPASMVTSVNECVDSNGYVGQQSLIHPRKDSFTASSKFYAVYSQGIMHTWL